MTRALAIAVAAFTALSSLAALPETAVAQPDDTAGDAPATVPLARRLPDNFTYRALWSVHAPI